MFDAGYGINFNPLHLSGEGRVRGLQTINNKPQTINP
jgi:hypothetical protein